MFDSARISERPNGVSRSNVSRWCCKVEARSGPTRPESTRLSRGQHRSRLGRRRLDRRHQLSHYRGKRAGRAGREAARLLAGDHRQPAARLGCRRHALAPKGDLPRALFNQLSATYALIAGAPGFFTLRQPAPWLHPNGALEATSFYETKLLKSTLERLVDFDRINARAMRFSVGAVNVRTGNFVYFNTETHTIRPERDGVDLCRPAFPRWRSRMSSTGTAA